MENAEAKILIIEDDVALVKMYETKLTLEGFKVDKALDGEEAIRKLGLNDYDLVLLDLMLPKINGFDVLLQLRTSSWPAAKKPVIVLSNLGDVSDISKSRELGCTDYLIKANTTPNQVVEKVEHYLKK